MLWDIQIHDIVCLLATSDIQLVLSNLLSYVTPLILLLRGPSPSWNMPTTQM